MGELSTAHPALTEDELLLRVERVERTIVDCELGGRNLYLVIEHLTGNPPVLPGWFRLDSVGANPATSIYVRHRRWWSRADRREWKRKVRPILARH